ncbi:hypothetical protein SVIO_072050 [Streptomyces violaceusniger]|uniref:Uncharacterized protein n=1 Tax=Streptomyces violaceusniger TaxID=68280 RepID=A0A4D4L5Z6_STRVO|nr:hypothetical protein SVIO_072050 [Streptomyces violaceusniger]
MGGEVVIEAQIGFAVAEEDRRSRFVFTDLDGGRDAAVGDALQYLVLTPGGASGRLLRGVGGLLADEVDAYAALLVHQSVDPFGEPVLPRLSGVQRVGPHPPRLAELQVRGRLADADGLEELRQLVSGELGGDALFGPVRGQAQEVLPNAGQPAGAVVAAEDPDPLYVVEVTFQVGGREEHGRLDTGQRAVVHAQSASGPLELPLEVFRLGIVEMEGVVDGPSAVGTVEVPGGAPVLQPTGVALDLDEVEPGGDGDQQIALVDPAGLRGEGEGRPGPVGLGSRHQAAYVVEGVLLPCVRGRAFLVPLVLGPGWRPGLGHRVPPC